MEKPLIRTLSFHHRQRYGFAVGKIPLDLGVVCPNRRQGGCIFCLPAGFAPWYIENGVSLDVQLARGRKFLVKNHISHFFAYYQQETATALASDRLLPIFADMLSDTSCLGLIISTRPDCLEEHLLSGLSALLHDTGKSCLFELGLQTVHEKSLALLNRNHTYEDFLTSFKMLKRLGGFEIGVHLLFGIPGETRQMMAETLRVVCDLGVDALKFHHLQVVRHTPLQAWYERGGIELFTERRYLDLLLDFLPLVPEHVVMHRLWATTHPHLLLAPRWNVSSTVLSARLRTMMTERGLRQGLHAPAPHHSSGGA